MKKDILQVSFKGALRAVADLVMPRACVVCKCELAADEQDICPKCREDIPLTYYWLRTRNPMADALNSKIGNQGNFRSYSYAAALFFYSKASGYSSISKALKYERHFKVGRHFGAMLGERIAGAEHFSDVDLAVPVPLHWTRRFSRGYNQAEIIARAVAAALDVPVSAELLVRKHRTGTQTHLGSAEKAANVSGAFAIGKRPSVPPRHILLIDDVFTTGSTLAECHRVLASVYGPEVRISCATLGYAGFL